VSAWFSVLIVVKHQLLRRVRVRGSNQMSGVIPLLALDKSAHVFCICDFQEVRSEVEILDREISGVRNSDSECVFFLKPPATIFRSMILWQVSILSYIASVRAQIWQP